MTEAGAKAAEEAPARTRSDNLNLPNGLNRVIACPLLLSTQEPLVGILTKHGIDGGVKVYARELWTY